MRVDFSQLNGSLPFYGVGAEGDDSVVWWDPLFGPAQTIDSPPPAETAIGDAAQAAIDAANQGNGDSSSAPPPASRPVSHPVATANLPAFHAPVVSTPAVVHKSSAMSTTTWALLGAAALGAYVYFK